MKKLLFFFIIIGIFGSCNKDDDHNTNTELIGSWKLIAIYTDPGDGSGSFEPVELNKTITFQNNGTITCNGELCSMTTTANTTTSGTYSLANATFSSSNCYPENYEYPFQLSDNILIISYPCIEPCQAKYKKL